MSTPPTTGMTSPRASTTSTAGPHVFCIEWNAENRLTAVKQGGNTLASFTYDGGGRRATKTAGGVTITYVYDGAQFLEERPGAGTAKRYVYGLGIDRPLAQSVGSGTSYFLADHLGSIAQVTDSAGAPTLTREYDPWGDLLQGSTTSGYAFTGREWDPETALYYYRARYYDAKVGRFASEDPSGRSGAENLYAYVVNNPARLSDPSGLRPGDGFWTPEDAVIDTFQFIADHGYDYKWDAWEYGGMVCEAPNGCVSCTEPITDRLHRTVEPRRSPCKSGTKQVGWYHTHPPDSGPGFSPGDRYRSSPSQDNVPAYALQTSDGKVLKYVWARASSAYTIIGQVSVPRLK